MIKAPVFGTGFFHRGFEFSKSSLDEVGSHNFWLQMFLETGIVGGGLVLLIFWRMWRQAVFLERKGEKLAIAVQSAFVAAFVGGMSGEYFYGGIALFTLFIVYAPIGSLPYKKVKPQVRLLFSNLKHARQCPDEAKPSPEAPK